MSIDELTFEVHKPYLQKPIKKDHLTQIHEGISDQASRITFLNRSLKSEIPQVKSDIAQNTSLATNNDGMIKEGLMELEKQATANGAATVELRVDVQAAVSSIAQHPALASATGAAPPSAPELQAMRTWH